MKFQKNLKKIFLSFFFCFLISNYSFAIDKWSTKLSQIEQSFYGFSYNKEDINKRLERLEIDIYGNKQNKETKTRIEKLYKDLNVEVKPITNNNLDLQKAYNNQETIENNIGPKAEAGIKYPIVDKLETKAFGKSYVNDDIYVRLSRLEKKVFQKESTNSLNERVSALRDKLLGGEMLAQKSVDTSQDEIILENGQKIYGDSYSDVDLENPNYNYYSYENSKTKVPETNSYNYAKNTKENNYTDNYDLNILEKSIFGTQYPNESSSTRLARIETTIFNRTFSDSDEARIQRLLAVTTAQKTSKEYDANKWAQRVNTGIQIGSILLMVLAMIL